MTPIELERCIAALLAAWPHSRQTPETFELGEALLGPLPAGAVLGAIATLALEGREFAPPLGLVARRAAELVEEATNGRPPDVEEALREVYEQISRCGYYRTPEWSSPAIGGVIEALGGWEAVCTDDNPEAFRAHFLRLYGTVQARVQRESLVTPAVRQLVGTLDFRADRELDA